MKNIPDLIDIMSIPQPQRKSYYTHEVIRYYFTANIPLSSTCVEVDVSCTDVRETPKEERQQILDQMNSPDHLKKNGLYVMTSRERNSTNNKKPIKQLETMDDRTMRELFASRKKNVSAVDNSKKRSRKKK